MTKPRARAANGRPRPYLGKDGRGHCWIELGSADRVLGRVHRKHIFGTPGKIAARRGGSPESEVHTHRTAHLVAFQRMVPPK